MNYYKNCVDHLGKGQFSEAELLALKWVQVCPDEFAPYAVLVFAYQAQNSWGKLIEAGERYLRLWDGLEKGMHTFPPAWEDRWKVLLFMGQAHLSLNNEYEADGLFQQSVSASDDRAACLAVIARIYKLRKRYKEAMTYLQEAREENPENHDILYNMARVYGRTGDREARVNTLKKLMGKGSLEFLDSLEILDYEIEIKAWKEAEKVLTGIIKDYSTDAELCLRAGMIYSKSGEFVRAINFFEQAAKIDSSDPKAFALMSFLLPELGRDEEALDIIDDFLEDKVNFISVHLAATWNFWLHGQVEDTIRALDRVYGLLNVHNDRVVSSFEDLVQALIKLGIELGQRMGIVERHLALEIAERIGKDTEVSVDEIEVQKADYSDARESQKMSVALCMIVKDEEVFLDDCLKSVSPLVDEIVIVDTGSRDRTIEIAKEYGAEVYNFKWCDDYSKARNFSIKQAKCDWILVMDADEVISEQDLSKIKELLKDDEVDGYRFILRNYENDRTLANIVLNSHDYEEGEGYLGFIPASLIRVFRRDRAVFFSGAVHETMDLSFKRSDLVAKNTDIPIL